MIQFLVKITLENMDLIGSWIKKSRHVYLSWIDLDIGDVLALSRKVIDIHSQIGHVAIRAAENENSVTTYVEGKRILNWAFKFKFHAFPAVIFY